MTFQERLSKASENGYLCIGLDPVPERLPEPLRKTRNGVARFVEAIILATAPYAASYKPNLAFYEALGKDGEAALERAVDAVRVHAPHALLIGDGKRGDIGSTAERYASALFDRYGFDAATVNPWFGSDGVLPFSQRPEHGVYLLAATSNPSSAQVQESGDDPLYLRIAKLAQEEWNEHNNIGLVVGATRVETMDTIRKTAPDLPWLIPGVGAQGGDLDASVRHGMTGSVLPSMINSSRGILYASSGEDFQEASAREAKKLAEAIQTSVGNIQES
ncbi:orotidine-5'-phosphate decarboxylase [bacterium]|nr:orotidine-5'-phosphate decarboxylase [bacterium]